MEKKLYIPKEVYEKDVNLGRKLYALGKACDKITPKSLNEICRVPAFLEAISAYEGDFSNEAVCDLLLATCKGKSKYEFKYYRAIPVMNTIMKSVYGVPYKPDQTLRLPENCEDLEYLYGVLAPLSFNAAQYLLSDDGFLKIARDSGPLLSLEDVYYAVIQLFFPVVRFGYKGSPDKAKSVRYLGLRSATKQICSLVFGNPDQWRIDYAAHFGFKYRPPLVSKNQSE